MDIKEIKSFVEEMMTRIENSGVSALELEIPGLKLRLDRNYYGSQVMPQVAPFLPGAEAPTPVPAAPAAEAAPVQPAIPHGNVLKSPMVGTFYASPSPDAPPFVKVGDTVKKGDTLCIIEAMKMMNEIESEHDGTVASVLAANGSLIEFGQPIIVIT